MLERIKAMLFRWNLEERQIACVQKRIDEYNYKSLCFLAVAFVLLYVFCLCFSVYKNLYGNAVVVHVISSTLSCGFLFIFFKFRDFTKKHIKVFYYLYITVMMIYTVGIDATWPTDLAVIYAPNVLLFMCLFIERPYRLIIFFILWELDFICTSIHYKNDYELFIDVADTIGYTIMAMFLSYHMNKVKVQSLYREYEIREIQLKEASLRLKSAELDLLQRQISPHFIYNTMNAISGLCKIDPERAEELIGLFSKYLRGNIDTMGNKKLIPLKEELANVNCFVNIISIRYQEEYEVIYDLQETGFEIPIFSLEPIVENSIVHGLRNTKGDKVVFVSTQREDKEIHIVVEDKGVGFDVSETTDHVPTGIKNVAYRLEHLVNGRLEIHSQLGKGTKVDIWIPVKE